jgi:hypothetical protein
MLKIICIEERATDPAIGKAAGPAMQREAPYMALSCTKRAASAQRNPHRPTLVPTNKVGPLATDLGKRRIKAMDEQAIQMQVVSWGSPIQMVPASEEVVLTLAANDKLAKAIAQNPLRLSGFAALPWDCRKFCGHAATATGGYESLAGRNLCPKLEPKVPSQTAHRNLKQQIGAAPRPSHLLRFVHPTVHQEIGRPFGDRGANS